MLVINKPESFQDTPWQPAADVCNCPDGWLIKFDLAGVRSQDIDLSVSGCRLIISGVRRDWTMEAGQRFHSMEISYNRFQRSLELPCDLNQARISTEYRDGMLLVRLFIARR